MLYLWSMNKKIFIGLVILMGISMAGIITIQLIWINNALRVKNELFSRGVTEVMNNSVARLEHMHDFTVFNRMALDDTLLWINEGRVPPPPPALPKILKRGIKSADSPQIVHSPGNVNGHARIQIYSGDDNKNTYLYEYRINSSGNKKFISDNDPNKERVGEIVITHNDSVIGTLDSVFNFGIVKIDSVVTSFDTLAYALPDIRNRVAVKAGRLKKIANQVVTEIRAWDVTKVDAELVGKVLKEEFSHNGIPIHFEFGIFKDSILTDKSEMADSALLAASSYQANLYPNDVIQKNLRLSLYFPGKGHFILRSMNWLLFASFLLSAFILATFALSIYFILRQKKISEMKSDFINNMTHEFKTPIATISVAVDSITNEKVISDRDRVGYFAGMIRKENTRMNRQVEDILTIARLDRKDFEFKWEPVNVEELIEDAIQSIILQVEKRGGKIYPKFNATNPVITTDRNHFTNLVYNLLDNANKYSADAPEITISTRNTPKGIAITVEDNGIGMTKSVQSKIFERFYRQASGNIHNVKGFGLGLSYVKAVVEANRGFISVHSESGKGSRFEVFLPFLRE